MFFYCGIKTKKINLFHSSLINLHLDSPSSFDISKITFNQMKQTYSEIISKNKEKKKSDSISVY